MIAKLVNEIIRIFTAFLKSIPLFWQLAATVTND